MDSVDCINLVNKLIVELNLAFPRITNISNIRSDLLVALFENIFKVIIPEIIKCPSNLMEEEQNIQAIIDSLSMDVLHMSLSHITPENIISGHLPAISELLMLFDFHAKHQVAKTLTKNLKGVQLKDEPKNKLHVGQNGTCPETGITRSSSLTDIPNAHALAKGDGKIKRCSSLADVKIAPDKSHESPFSMQTNPKRKCVLTRKASHNFLKEMKELQDRRAHVQLNSLMIDYLRQKKQIEAMKPKKKIIAHTPSHIKTRKSVLLPRYLERKESQKKFPTDAINDQKGTISETSDVSPAVIRRMNIKYMHHLKCLSNNILSSSRKKSLQQKQIEKVAHQQAAQSKILLKDVAVQERIASLKEQQQIRHHMKAAEREQKITTARFRKYFEMFDEKKMTQLLRRKQAHGESLTEKTFQWRLNSERESVLDTQRRKRESDERRAKREALFLEEREKFYSTQLESLAESIFSEKERLRQAEILNRQEVERQKREFRKKLEKDVVLLQENIVNSLANMHIREREIEYQQATL